MPGYYPMPSRDPGPMVQMYPPSRSYSLAKLNVPRDFGIYEKVKVENRNNPHRMFDKLRRQQSYDDNMYPRMMYTGPPRRPEGFDSLQLLGAQNDDRYLDNFMESSRARTLNRDNEKNNKNTLLSTKSKNSNNSNGSNNSNKKSNNKENKRKGKEGKEGGMSSLSSIALALFGSLANSSSVDNIYESVEQIHYRKTLETLNRLEKVRDVHRTGHPLFDHLREERALASGTTGKRTSRSAGPSRKTSTVTSPTYSSNSSGDEQEIKRVYREDAVRRERMQTKVPPTKMRRAGSAGSESEDEWVIPRPKFGGRKRDSHIPSTDESDSSSKSIPMR